MLCPIYFIIVRKYHIFLQPYVSIDHSSVWKLHALYFLNNANFLYILIYELLALFSVFYPNHFKEADFRQASYSGINWMIPICGKAVYGVIPVYW